MLSTSSTSTRNSRSAPPESQRRIDESRSIKNSRSAPPESLSRIDEFIKKRNEYSRGPTEIIDLTKDVTKDDDANDANIDPNSSVCYTMNKNATSVADELDMWEYGADPVAWMKSGWGFKVIVRIGLPAFCIYRLMSGSQFPYDINKEIIPELKNCTLPKNFPMQLKFLGIRGIAYRGSGPETMQPKTGKRFTHTYVNVEWNAKKDGKIIAFDTWETRSRFKTMNQITNITNYDEWLYTHCKEIEERANRNRKLQGHKKEQVGQSESKVGVTIKKEPVNDNHSVLSPVLSENNNDPASEQLLGEMRSSSPPKKQTSHPPETQTSHPPRQMSHPPTQQSPTQRTEGEVGSEDTREDVMDLDLCQ